MNRRYILLVIAILMGLPAFAQKPLWIRERPTPTNSTFLYIVENGFGKTVLEAKNNAIAEVFRTTAMRIGAVYDSKKIFEALQKGTEYEVISREFNIPIYKVCEYSEKSSNGYTVYLLCQVAFAGNIEVQWDTNAPNKWCGIIDHHDDIKACLESLIVPGLGQYEKGRHLEGVITLLSEIVFAAGVWGTKEIGLEQLKTIHNANVGYDEFIKAKNKYETAKAFNWEFLGLASGVYILNMWRAWSITTPNEYANLYIGPTITPFNNDLTLGMGVTYNF